MNANSIKILEQGCASLDISLVPHSIDQFSRYISMLRLWNARLNLISKDTEEEIVTRHILDSLVLCAYHPAGFSLASRHIIDAGSGAGFPGIPLAIIEPSLQVTFVEARLKRATFIREAVTALGIHHAAVEPERLENLSHREEYREQYNLVCVRALAGLDILAELCLPFITIGGYLIAFKAAGINNEMESAAYAMRLLGADEPEIFEFKVPCSDISRVLLFYKKISQSPAKYPRRAGIPEKRPLMPPH